VVQAFLDLAEHRGAERPVHFAAYLRQPTPRHGGTAGQAVQDDVHRVAGVVGQGVRDRVEAVPGDEVRGQPRVQGVGRVEHHRLAGLDVLPVGVGAAEVAADGPDRVQGEAVGERVGLAAHIRLDCVRQRVDAGVSGQSGGHRQGQFEVDDGGDRQERGPRAEHLLVRGAVGDDGELGGLGAAAGGRRDRDHRNCRAEVGSRGLVVPHPPALDAQQAEGLGGLHRAAAAESDHRVRLVLPQDVQSRAERVGRRIRDGFGEQERLQTGVPQRRHQPLRRTGSGEERVRHQQGAAQAQPRDHIAQFTDGATPDAQDPGQGKAGNHGGPFSRNGAAPTPSTVRPAQCAINRQ
jgi:hypothetical protein